MKKTLGLLMALCLALSLSLPAGALSIVPPEDYNDRYDYFYVDYNRDGRMELAIHGGEAGGYSDDKPPEWKIFAYADGKVKLFKPKKSSKTIGLYPWGGTPSSYRNWLTRQRKWITENGVMSWGGVTTYEVEFNFQNFQYEVVKTKKYKEVLLGALPNLRFALWRFFWKPEPLEGFHGAGTLTNKIIKELLLNAPKT